ncbi:hypothetical protein [Endozoicomonas atrinae]|uniref:hypothetical protein n=1 Tax=Endozoicomonas atrinae TaxID=1333660 RepID=UPI001113009F|nr:hypothetical protein [Endozoicomonas atrinae]
MLAVLKMFFKWLFPDSALIVLLTSLSKRTINILLSLAQILDTLLIPLEKNSEEIRKEFEKKRNERTSIIIKNAELRGELRRSLAEINAKAELFQFDEEIRISDRQKAKSDFFIKNGDYIRPDVENEHWFNDYN